MVIHGKITQNNIIHNTILLKEGIYSTILLSSSSLVINRRFEYSLFNLKI